MYYIILQWNEEEKKICYCFIAKKKIMSHPRLPPPFAATRAFFFRHFTWGKPPPCLNEDESEEEYCSSSSSDEDDLPNINNSFDTNIAYKNPSDIPCDKNDPLAIGPSTICRLSEKQIHSLKKEHKQHQRNIQSIPIEPTFKEILYTTPPPVIVRSNGRFISTRRYNPTRSFRRRY